MNRREFAKKIVIGTGAGLMGMRSAAVANGPVGLSGPKPNFVFIFPDQMRLHALGIWSQNGYDHLIDGVTDPVHTPNLDRLAKESVLFTQATSTHPVCSPFRAMFLSGMYPSQNGVTLNCYAGRAEGLHNNITCFTDVLFNNGYDTGYFGKTHWEKNEALFDANRVYVGTTTPPGGQYTHNYDTYIPPGAGRHGNRHWFQNVGDGHNSATSYSSEPELIGGKSDGEPYFGAQFGPRQETNGIVDFINNENGERDPDKPFSIIWSPNPPHPPYRSIGDVDPVVYNEYYKDVPLEVLNNRPNNIPSSSNDSAQAVRYYLSLVTSVDEQVGRIMDTLEAVGMAENTILVFTSDHGEMMGSQGRMSKNVIYEEAFRIPFMIRYPAKLSHRIEDLMISPVDFMPTFLGMMGLENQIPESVMGTNYGAGMATGDFGAKKPKSALYLKAKLKGVRTDTYTYQVGDDGATLLFNNKEDPYQLNNLDPSAIPPEDLAFLKEELGIWLRKAGDPWYTSKMQPGLITYPTYLAWARKRFPEVPDVETNPATAFTGDFDENGLHNGLEYAFLEPDADLDEDLEEDIRLNLPTISDGHVRFTLPEPPPQDVDMKLESSSNLSSWRIVARRAGTAPWTSTVTTTGMGGHITVDYEGSPTTPQFFRLTLAKI